MYIHSFVSVFDKHECHLFKISAFPLLTKFDIFVSIKKQKQKQKQKQKKQTQHSKVYQPHTLVEKIIILIIKTKKQTNKNKNIYCTEFTKSACSVWQSGYGKNVQSGETKGNFRFLS